MDADFSYMETLAGGGRNARTIAYNALTARIKSKCPANFKVGGCSLQALRKNSGGYGAMCTGDCTTFASIDSSDACLTSGELPQSLWKHQCVRTLAYPPPPLPWWLGGRCRSHNLCACVVVVGGMTAATTVTTTRLLPPRPRVPAPAPLAGASRVGTAACRVAGTSV